MKKKHSVGMCYPATPVFYFMMELFVLVVRLFASMRSQPSAAARSVGVVLKFFSSFPSFGT